MRLARLRALEVEFDDFERLLNLPREGEADRFGDLDSPLMQLARIGVVAA